MTCGCLTDEVTETMMEDLLPFVEKFGRVLPTFEGGHLSGHPSVNLEDKEEKQ
jgi:hypothetical protein